MHDLDVVLSDAPVHPGLRIRAYSHRLGDCGDPARATGGAGELGQQGDQVLEGGAVGGVGDADRFDAILDAQAILPRDQGQRLRQAMRTVVPDFKGGTGSGTP